MTEQIISQIVHSWTAQNKAVSDFFNKYEDDVYLSEVAPGRNRGIYLLAHLIATSDGLLPLFGIGEKLYPELEVIAREPDQKTLTGFPPLSELKTYWETVNTTLAGHFSKMTAEDWLSRHTKVSVEDFAKEPQRNKLNVLLGRTVHQSYHFGQMNLLTRKELVS